MRGTVRRLTATIALVGAVTALAACGSDDDPQPAGGDAPAAAKTTGQDGGGTAAAKQFVAEHNKLTGLEYPQPPDEAYDPGAGTLAVLACGTAGAGCLGQSKAAVAAGKAAGWKVLPIGDGKFTPSTQSGLIQQWVQQKVDGIVLAAVDLTAVKTAVDAALAAKIPVSCVMCTPTPGFGEDGPVTLVSTDGEESGRFLGTYVAANSAPGDKVLLFRDKAFPVLEARSKAFKAAIDEYCPECVYKDEFISTSALTQPGPPYFRAALSANPEGKLAWALVPSDSFNIPAVKTAAEQGRSVGMAGVEAEAAFLELMVSTPKNARATVWNPVNYAGFAGAEQVIRQKAGLEPWDAYGLPQAIVDSPETAKELLSAAPSYYDSPDFDYKAMFEKLWNGGAS